MRSILATLKSINWDVPFAAAGCVVSISVFGVHILGIPETPWRTLVVALWIWFLIFILIALAFWLASPSRCRGDNGRGLLAIGQKVFAGVQNVFAGVRNHE